MDQGANSWNHQGSAGSELNCKQIESRYQRRCDVLAQAEGKIREIAGAFGLLGDAEKRKGTERAFGQANIQLRKSE